MTVDHRAVVLIKVATPGQTITIAVLDTLLAHSLARITLHFEVWSLTGDFPTVTTNRALSKIEHPLTLSQGVNDPGVFAFKAEVDDPSLTMPILCDRHLEHIQIVFIDGGQPSPAVQQHHHVGVLFD